MKDAITVVDLGLGNIRSVARAFERAGADTRVTSDAGEVRDAGRVVVPGQGAFRDCAHAIEGPLGSALQDHLTSGKPYVGLCLGMQVLFEDSEEAPGLPGLGLIPGRVRRFPPGLHDEETEQRLKIPHMGWNEVSGRHPILPDRAWFYFVHSYYCDPRDESLVAGTATHGVTFCAALVKDNVFACQFHPEKSHRAGQRLVSGLLEQWS